MIRNRVSSSKPIFEFFPKAKKLETSASAFYKDFLPNVTTETNVPENIECSSEDKSECDEIDLLKAENARLKSELVTVTAECGQLKVENQKLSRDLKSMKKLLNETSVLSASKEIKLKILEKKSAGQELLYEDHQEILGEATLKDLRKVPVKKRNDSTFVLKVMRRLCSDDIQSLQMITACGRAENGLFSAENRILLQNIFTERLASLNLEEPEWIERFSRLNELINGAINNIIRSKVN